MTDKTSTQEAQAKAVVGLVGEIMKRTCVECGQTFTDPNEYVFGHDCEGGE